MMVLHFSKRIDLIRNTFFQRITTITQHFSKRIQCLCSRFRQAFLEKRERQGDFASEIKLWKEKGLFDNE